MPISTLNVTLLASGGGTTAEAVTKATAPGGELHNKIRIAGLIASKPGIGAIPKLRAAGLGAEQISVISRNAHASPDDFGAAIIAALGRFGTDFYWQCGWLPLTPANVVHEYADRGANQHPAALDPTPQGSHPDFGGKGMHGKAAIAAQLYFAQSINQSFYAEATAHMVKEQFDTGLLLRTNRQFINRTWSVDELQARLLPIEHWTQIAALRQLYEDGELKTRAHEREERLILPGEEAHWRDARARAVADYPHG